jgi:NitT/TauT family transport system substrate-binding protein
MIRARRPLAGVVAVALVAAGLMASGCGGDSAGGARPENGRTKLTVGLLPIWDVVPVHLGVKKGFFATEGLDVEIRTAQGGAEIVPQVMSGDVQIGYSNTPTLFSAAAEGLPIEIVAPAAGPTVEKQGQGQNLEGSVMVPRDSSIRGYADLEGKTVAVNTVGNITDLTLKAALEKHRVDHTTVEYLEVPFPDMLAALDAGRVDAAIVASPFKTMAERSGRYRSIGFPLVDVRPDLVYTSYFASSDWAEQNGEVLERFRSALRRSMLYAAAHESETRETVGEFSQLPRELVSAIPIGDRRPDCAQLRASSEALVELMVRYDQLDREPDLDELIRPGFCDR